MSLIDVPLETAPETPPVAPPEPANVIPQVVPFGMSELPGQAPEITQVPPPPGIRVEPDREISAGIRPMAKENFKTEAEPTIGELLGTAFGPTTSNLVVNAWNILTAPTFERDGTFDIASYAAEKAPDLLLNYQDRLASVESQPEADHVIAQIREEQNAQAILARGGFTGLLAQFIADNADPLIFAPYVRVARMGWDAARAGRVGLGFAEGAANVGVAVATQEAIAQAAQETRDAYDFTSNVATGIVLGGMLGSFARYMAPDVKQDIHFRLRGALESGPGVASRGVDLGLGEFGPATLVSSEKYGPPTRSFALQYATRGYHATMRAFDKFSKSTLGQNTGAYSATQGFFASKRVGTAHSYLEWDRWPNFDLNNLPAPIKAQYDANEKLATDLYYEADKLLTNKYFYGDAHKLAQAADYFTSDGAYDIIRSEITIPQVRNALDEYRNAQLTVKRVDEKQNAAIVAGVTKAEDITRLQEEMVAAQQYVSKSYDKFKDVHLQYEWVIKRDFDKKIEEVRDKQDAALAENQKIEDANRTPPGYRPGANIWPVRIRLQNPLTIDYKGQHYRETTFGDAINRAKALGHDGVIFQRAYDPGGGPTDIKPDGTPVFDNQPDDIYVAFDEDQILSDFDPIFYSDWGLMGDEIYGPEELWKTLARENEKAFKAEQAAKAQRAKEVVFGEAVVGPAPKVAPASAPPLVAKASSAGAAAVDRPMTEGFLTSRVDETGVKRWIGIFSEGLLALEKRGFIGARAIMSPNRFLATQAARLTDMGQTLNENAVHLDEFGNKVAPTSVAPGGTVENRKLSWIGEHAQFTWHINQLYAKYKTEKTPKLGAITLNRLKDMRRDRAMRDPAAPTVNIMPWGSTTMADGGKLTYTEFNNQVGMQVRRLEQEGDGSKHPIPEVVQAAQEFMRLIEGPMGDAGEAAALFTKLKTDKQGFRHLYRRYLVDKIVKFPTDFKDLLKRHYVRVVEAEFQEQLGKYQEKAAKLEARIAAETDPDIIKGLKADQKALEADFAREWEERGSPGLSDEERSKYGTRESTASIDLAKGTINLTDEANELADQIFWKITQNNFWSSPLIDILGDKRGPELQRMLRFVPEAELEPWIDNHIGRLTASYVRTLAPDIELARIWGGEVDFAKTEAFAEVREEHIRLLDTLPESERNAFQAQFEKELEAFGVMVNRLRNRRGVPENPDHWTYRIGSALMTLNYTSMLGLQTFGSIADIAKPILHMGLSRAFGDVYAPFFRSLQRTPPLADQHMRDQAWAFGAGTEMQIDVTSLTWGDMLTETINRRSAAGRFLENMSQNFGFVSLMAPFNANNRKFIGAAVLLRHIRNIEAQVAGTATDEQLEELARAGLVGDLPRRIWREMTSEREGPVLPGQEMKQGGTQIDGMWFPNAENWTDADARRALDAAMFRELNNINIQPSIGRPGWLDKSIGWRMIGQFRSFNMETVNRTLAAGLQQRDASVVAGLAAMVGMGAVSYTVRSLLKGGEDEREMRELPWQAFLAKALDQGGVMGPLSDISRIAEATAFGGLAQWAGAEHRFRPDHVGLMQQLLGPSFASGIRMAKIGSDIAEEGMQQLGRDVSGGINGYTVHNARMLVPLTTIPLIAQGLDAVERATVSAFGLEPRRNQ